MTHRWIFAFVFIFGVVGKAQTPEWIWHSERGAEEVHFRKTFRTPPYTWNSRLTVSADDAAEVFLNGVLVAEARDWRRPLRAEVTVRLNQGENVIAVRARNTNGPAGLLVHLNVGGQTNFVSDGSWLASTNGEAGWTGLGFNAAHWTPAVSVARHGEAPWGDVLFKPAATPAELLKVSDGFRAELLHSAEPGEGSWICVAFDSKGRLIVSPEGDTRPLLRVTFANGTVEKIEPIAAPLRYAMGLLDVDGTLYANARGPKGAGLYRVEDKDGNDRLEAEELEFIKGFEGGSEHGYHALALGPDKKIYILNGNGTKLPEGIAADSPYRNYAEDALSGARGELDGSPVPACYVLRFDPASGKFDLFAGGMRNAYDFDFNEEGELFTFDSDMEWDWGTPWYKPTRILHLVSGGEYGWRDGTRMWRDYFPDGLPPAVNAGIGSPTGVKFGTRAKFPEKYRRAMFAMDWSYGRIFAVHLEAKGSSYGGRWETFLEGKPLNLTSLAFGPDGAMYFVTGGRGTQSGLYRVSYMGADQQAGENSGSGRAAVEDREARGRLEGMHGREAPGAVETVWPKLGHPDRFVRFAAAVALESQEAGRWRDRALQEGAPEIALEALRALTRVSGREAQPEILRALARFPLSALEESRQLAKLRVLQISIARHGRPEGELANATISELSAAYPARSGAVNTELARILLRLAAPGAVAKTVELLGSAKLQEEQVHYVELLRNVRSGWSAADREAFFRWFTQPREPKAHAPELLGYFADVGRSYVDGAYFDKYLRDFRREAIATLTAAERTALAPLLSQPIVQARSVPAAPREFVRAWTMEDVAPELEGARTANLERGRRAFVDAQCLSCHRFGNDGGMSGPELTGAGSKYSARDLLESILEPSKVLSDQYQNHTVVLKDGDSYSGRLLAENEKQVVLEIDRLAGTKETFPRAAVTAVRPSPVSPMPEGLVNVLGKEEILDLLAYLRSSGSEGKQ